MSALLTSERFATVLAIGTATAIAVFLTWPRPDLTIRVVRGGSAVVVPRLGGEWRRQDPLPRQVSVHPGALVRVINEDTAWARLSVFSAPPASDDVARAPLRPGRFTGFCSAHANRSLTVVIE